MAQNAWQSKHCRSLFQKCRLHVGGNNINFRWQGFSQLASHPAIRLCNLRSSSRVSNMCPPFQLFLDTRPLSLSPFFSKPLLPASLVFSCATTRYASNKKITGPFDGTPAIRKKNYTFPLIWFSWRIPGLWQNLPLLQRNVLAANYSSMRFSIGVATVASKSTPAAFAKGFL